MGVKGRVLKGGQTGAFKVCGGWGRAEVICQSEQPLGQGGGAGREGPLFSPSLVVPVIIHLTLSCSIASGQYPLLERVKRRSKPGFTGGFLLHP